MIKKLAKYDKKNMQIVENGTKGVSNDQQRFKLIRKSQELEWSASSRWSSSLYWPTRNTDKTTIVKVHPTLTSNQKSTKNHKNDSNSVF